LADNGLTHREAKASSFFCLQTFLAANLQTFLFICSILPKLAIFVEQKLFTISGFL
jgi:hypothetical protein